MRCCPGRGTFEKGSPPRAPPFQTAIACLQAQASQAAITHQAQAGRILPAGSRSSVDTSWIQTKFLALPYAPLSAALAGVSAGVAALGMTGAMGATNATTSAESYYLGKTIGLVQAQPLVEAACPRTNISHDETPFLIQHGTMDINIPITQSIEFARSLTQVLGNDKVIYEAPGGAGHGGGQSDNAASTAKVLDFLDKALW